MAERKMLFNLDLPRFRQVWDRNDWSNLQKEFKTKKILLSNSLLTWQDAAIWYLADFENTKTYDIEMVGDATENPMVEIWERGDEDEQLVTSNDPETILSRLQSVKATNLGYIDLLRRLNLAEINFQELNRSDLSGAGFSFEFPHPNLLMVHGMCQDILTSSRESLLNLSWNELDIISQNLRQFYATVEEIENFDISDENPREAHAQLLERISQFCDSAKESLRNILAFLSSRKVNEFEAKVNVTVAEAEDQLNNVMNKVNEIGKTATANEAARQKKFEELELAIQNQLVEKPISQYKAIFQEQAKMHQKGSRFWLVMAGVATLAFAVAFILLSIFVKIEGAALSSALQNLFTKGFLLSPIYVWLNRSIKNHTAQKHLEVINTHRQNALETFDTFVAAAEGDRETRDAVLLAATEAIFDANQTGYLSTKTTGPDNRSPVQQVIREIIPQKSATKDS